jgi:hypothetical protein
MAKLRFYNIFIIAFLFASCSRSIYYAEDSIIDSKIILKKSKFKLIEKNGGKTLRHNGIYELNDSTMTLLFERDSTLPIITSTSNITVISQSENSDTQKMTVVSVYGDPSFLAEVVLRDKNQRIIKKINPNFDGEVTLKNLNEISEIEISSPIDARTIVFEFQKYRNKNIEVKLEPIKWGGETITNPDCGMVYSIQPIIVAKIAKNQNNKIMIFLDEKVYLAE